MQNVPEPRNLLADQSSPYLLQHASNPVHWRPWSEPAFTEAVSQDKPILLSIGYAACHWCHVMAHESFENPEIADLMNEFFINIKVDREERADVDQIYMAALHAMGEQGGWPLTMFLFPDKRPFWGGTYFPPEPRYGRPGFAQLLHAIHRAWTDDRQTLQTNATALGKHVSSISVVPAAPGAAPRDLFNRLAASLLEMHDPVNGGIRGSPKFPNAPMTETWFRAANGSAATDAGSAFLHTIKRISLGGIYDHLAGGIARYSTDEQWLVPHFEKMLYDNAHYIRCLTWANQLEPNPLFRARIEQTVRWLSSEMRQQTGAYASSLDADTEGHEGKYYLWSKHEIDSILGPDAETFCARYGVSESGNFEGANILNLLGPALPSQKTEYEYAQVREKLLAARRSRPSPAVDDKILADWNGYLIRALAEAGFALDQPKWNDQAAAAFRFITESMQIGAKLSHSWRDGIHVRPALSVDYAAMMNAAISLYLSTQDTAYLDQALSWLTVLDTDYSDNAGGYFLTSVESTDLLTRPRGDIDDPNPSPASQVLEAVTRLAQITGKTELLDKAHAIASNLYASIKNSRFGSAGFANALHTLHHGRHVTCYADNPEESHSWLGVLRTIPDPALTWDIRPHHSAKLHHGTTLPRPEISPAALVCTQMTCSPILTKPEELRRFLADPNR